MLADFIGYYGTQGGSAKFLSANLDFSGEASLQALASAGVITSSTIVTRGAEQYGVIGATIEILASISSPGAITAGNVLAAVQAEVDALTASGVNRIILSSHLQSIVNEQALVSQLRGVDVVIAGGGDELLSNDATTPFGAPSGPYPITSTVDADGKPVAIVTTTGEYRYLGALDVEFDGAGEVVSVGGNPILIDRSVITPDAALLASVVAPVEAATADASANIVGTTEVALDGIRAHVRTRETNLGSLIADAYIWQAGQDGRAISGDPLLALTNAGGIRNDSVFAPGDLSEADITQNALPFSNFLTVLNGVDADRLKALLEHAVADVEAVGGRFAQIGGFEFSWNPSAEAGVNRVRDIALEDGTPIWDQFLGAVFPGSFDLVTIDFLANGGDGYDFSGLARTDLPFQYGEALLNYIASPAGLNGVVGAAAYPAGGLGRIGIVPEPATLVLMAGSLAALVRIRRRAA